MPTVSVTVDQGDVRAIERKLEAAERDALPKIVDAAAAYAQQQARAGAPRKSGALASSIVVEGKGLEARVHSPFAYALPVEFGRHPGAKMPPAGAFKGPFAFVIARAIAKRGIKGRFFLKRAVDMLRNSELPRLLQKAADEIETAWGRR